MTSSIQLPPWDGHARTFVALVAVTTVAYVVHHYFNRVPRDGGAREVFVQRLAGAVLLGGLPLYVATAYLGIRPPTLGLVPGHEPRITLALLGIVAVLILPFVAAGARKPAAWTHSPQVRARHLAPGQYLLSVLTWAIYLGGYELMFRGVLLLGLAPIIGPWPALAVSTSVYVLAHLGKPSGETLGSIPVGVLFGLTTLMTGSIVGPVLAHTAIAVVNDEVARRANRELE